MFASLSLSLLAPSGKHRVLAFLLLAPTQAALFSFNSRTDLSTSVSKNGDFPPASVLAGKGPPCTVPLRPHTRRTSRCMDVNVSRCQKGNPRAFVNCPFNKDHEMARDTLHHITPCLLVIVEINEENLNNASHVSVPTSSHVQLLPYAEKTRKLAPRKRVQYLL